MVPDYALLQVWRVVLLCAGLGCWLVAHTSPCTSRCRTFWA
ncbi:DmsC/YnfH family molybdoenzyme membrane anchor subunit [Shigella flexneri]